MKINYTESDVTKLKALYAEKGNAGIPAIAEEMGKPVKSITGKLVNLKIYVADAKAPAREKDDGPTKKDILAELAKLVPFNVDGLIPAKKEVIQAVLDFAKSAQSVETGDEPEAVAS